MNSQYADISAWTAVLPRFPDGLLVETPLRTVAAWSPQLEVIFGLAPEVISTGNSALQVFAHIAAQVRQGDELLELATRAAGSQAGALQLTAVDGRTVECRWCAVDGGGIAWIFRELTVGLSAQLALESAEDARRRMQAVWRRLSAALTVEDVCDVLTGHVVEIFGASLAQVWLTDRASGQLSLRAEMGAQGPVEPAPLQLRPDRDLLPIRVLTSGAAQYFTSAAARAKVYADLSELSDGFQQASATSQIAASGEVFGVFSMSFAAAREFSDAERELLDSITNHTAQALQRARLIVELHEHYSQLAVLAEVSTALAGSLDVRQTLKEIAERAVPAFADWCVIDLIGVEGNASERTAVANQDLGNLAIAREWAARGETTNFVGKSEFAKVLRTGIPRVWEQLSDRDLADIFPVSGPTPFSRATNLGLRSAMMLPLAVGGRRLGVMTFATSRSGQKFQETDLAFACQLADRAALAIDNALLFRESEARGRAAQVLANIGDGVVLVDRTGRVLLFNHAAAAITGCPEVAVLGRRAVDVIPGWREVVDRVSVSVSSRRERAQSNTLPLSDEQWLSISGVEFPEGTVYAFRDVTDERKVDRMKADFVATVSHELRTPLASVYGSALTLQRPDMQLDSQTRGELVAIIVDEAQRLTGIINDLLLASSLDAGRIVMAEAQLDIGALVASVVRSAQARIGEPVNVVVRCPDTPVVLVGDEDRLRQVLVNLVENAVKYSPAGRPIQLEVEVRGELVCISVCDEGIGIPARELHRVFEKFYRADAREAGAVSGTGLGLYICHELVSRMGGTIRVSSVDRQGSTFTLELPLAGSPPADSGDGSEYERL